MKSSYLSNPLDELIKEASEFFDEEDILAFINSEEEYVEKIAKITSMEERAKMRAYRNKNKAEIARKSKIRRRKEKQGVKRKKKRIGTAAGGYSFVESGPVVSQGRYTNPKVPSLGRTANLHTGGTRQVNHLKGGQFKVAKILQPVVNKQPERAPAPPPKFPVINKKLHPTPDAQKPKMMKISRENKVSDLSKDFL